MWLQTCDISDLSVVKRVEMESHPILFKFKTYSARGRCFERTLDSDLLLYKIKKSKWKTLALGHGSAHHQGLRAESFDTQKSSGGTSSSGIRTGLSLRFCESISELAAYPLQQVHTYCQRHNGGHVQLHNIASLQDTHTHWQSRREYIRLLLGGGTESSGCEVTALLQKSVASREESVSNRRGEGERAPRRFCSSTW